MNRPKGISKSQWLKDFQKALIENAPEEEMEGWVFPAITDDAARKKAVKLVLDRTPKAEVFEDMPYQFRLEMLVIEMAEKLDIAGGLFTGLQYLREPKRENVEIEHHPDQGKPI